MLLCEGGTVIACRRLSTFRSVSIRSCPSCDTAVFPPQIFSCDACPASRSSRFVERLHAMFGSQWPQQGFNRISFVGMFPPSLWGTRPPRASVVHTSKRERVKRWKVESGTQAIVAATTVNEKDAIMQNGTKGAFFRDRLGSDLD